MLLGMVRAYGSKPRVRHSAGMCLASASCPASLHASTWFVSALLCGWGVADIAQRPCVFAERTTTGSVCVVCRITEFRFDPKLLDVRSRIVLGTVRQRAYCRPCAHPPLLRNTTRRARLFIFQHQDPICSLTALLQVSIFAEPCGIFVSREAFSLCLVAARLGMREAFPRVIVLECHCTILHIIAFGRLTAMRLAIEPRASCA